MPRRANGKETLRIWLRLLSCESLLERHLRMQLRKEYNITLPQFDVLAELDYMDKAITMTALSRQLMVSNGNITGVVDRLVRDGFVERVSSPSDRRVQLIQLSKSGKRAFQKMASEHQAWVSNAFKGLGAEDARQLVSRLGAVLDILKSNIGVENE